VKDRYEKVSLMGANR